MQTPLYLTHHHQDQRHQPGFTLIELLIVLCIVGLLTLFAYPLYGDSVIKAKRAEAAAALLRAMQQQEQYYSQHNRYAAYQGQEAAFIWHSGSKPANSAYQISATACTGLALTQCVVLAATPGGALVDSNFQDDQCGTLTLNSQGEKTAADKPLNLAPHACQ